MKLLKKVNPTCKVCKGSCWDSSSQSQTQKNVLQKFGKIQNECVNDSNGRIHCPYAQK